MYKPHKQDLNRQFPILRMANIILVLVLILAFALSIPTSCFGYAWSSGSSISSDGTIYAWGVTDGTPNPGYSMTHDAYVNTTLTSPKGRTASTGYYKWGINTVRSDVSLPYDRTDLGTYNVQSFHRVYCIVMKWVLYDVVSASTAFFCDIPTGETISSGGWDTTEPAVHLWMQTLQPQTRLFGGRSVQEFATGTVQDDCWWSGSIIAKASLTNPLFHTGPWPVSTGNVWGPDKVGWTMTAVIYYRQNNRAPCTAIVPQKMGCLCTINSTYYSYLTHNLRMTLGTVSVSSARGSQTATRTLTTN